MACRADQLTSRPVLLSANMAGLRRVLPQGQVSVAASKALAAEALSDRYLDLRALLKLLAKLTQADWANQAPRGGGSVLAQEAVDVAQVPLLPLPVAFHSAPCSADCARTVRGCSAAACRACA